MSNYQYPPYQPGQQPPVSMPVLHNPFKPDRPALPFRAAGDKDVAKQQSIYSSSNKDFLTLKNRENWSSGALSNQQQQHQRQHKKVPQPAQVPVHGKIK